MHSAYRPLAELPGLTGLRGLAALTVFVAHAKFQELLPSLQPACVFFEWHALAVDLFFILSGFVLIHVYAARDEMTTGAGWWKYGAARVARIVPLYLITLLVVTVIFWISSFLFKKWPVQLEASTLVTNVLLIQNWPGFFHLSVNLTSWSLSVEWLCYVALMPVALVLYKWVPSWAALLLMLLLLGGRAMLTEEIEGWVSLGRGFSCFLAGGMLHRFHHSQPGRWTDAAAVLGALSLIILRSFVSWGDWSPNWLLISFPLLVIGLASSGDTWVHRFFGSRLMLWLGDISYSVYLCQGPVLLTTLYLIRPLLHSLPQSLLAVWLLVEITVMLLLATFSYRYVELPLRNRLRSSLAPKRSQTPALPRMDSPS